ncbi:hypothetical protein [uncultured Muribaculum sp.]|uniref:hypothetical protein n=1 Tax=uncultured Muribaculum sp. TaxID=1918613 RepID=UPI0025B195BD|nr:hypothetical protein [uncultured Muribaculum sp.]
MRQLRVLTFLFVMLSVLYARAQELTIAGFGLSAEIMHVSLQRKDANNQICAMLRVQLPVSGVKFSGNTVGDTPYDGSEYSVYMTPGTKFLKINCPGHYPLMIDFRDYGIDALEGKRIYKLKLKTHQPTQSVVAGTNQSANNVINGHECVDLGLSIMWATCNVGASSPEDYGNYYAWGETATKAEYTEANSKAIGKTMGDIGGNPQYDAARANWGGSWRLPTKGEFDELLNKCKWEWTTHEGKEGYRVTGPNGNNIFLPAASWRSGSSLYIASYGYYWCSIPYDDDVGYSYYLRFYNGNQRIDWNRWPYGYSIRPVSE